MSRSKILLRQNPDFRPQDRRQNPDFRPQDRRENPDFRPQDLRKNPPDDTDFWGYVKHYMDYSSSILMDRRAKRDPDLVELVACVGSQKRCQLCAASTEDGLERRGRTHLLKEHNRSYGALHGLRSTRSLTVRRETVQDPCGCARSDIHTLKQALEANVCGTDHLMNMWSMRCRTLFSQRASRSVSPAARWVNVPAQWPSSRLMPSSSWSLFVDSAVAHYWENRSVEATWQRHVAVDGLTNHQSLSRFLKLISS